VGQRSRRKLSVHVLGAGELSAAANGHAATAAAAPAPNGSADTNTCATKEAPTEPEAAAAVAAKPAAENGQPAPAAAAAAAPAKAAKPSPRPMITSPAALARMARVAADATGQRDGGQPDAPPPGGAPQQGASKALKTASLGNWDGPPGNKAAASSPGVESEMPAQQTPAGGDASAQQDGQPSQSTGVRAGSLGSWGAAQQGVPEKQPEPKSSNGHPAGTGTTMTAMAAARMAGIAANTVAQRSEAQGEEQAAPALRPPSLGNWAGAPKRTLAAASAPAAAGQRMERRMSLDTVPEQGAEQQQHEMFMSDFLAASVALLVVSKLADRCRS
jgi:hypothetical protein